MNCYTRSFPCCPLSAHDSAYQIKEVLLFGQPYYTPGVSFDLRQEKKDESEVELAIASELSSSKFSIQLLCRQQCL